MAVADTAPFPFGRTPASLVNQRPGRRPALSLLLADHDPDAAHQLVRHLSEHQIDVAVSSDGADALLRVGTTSPDVVILSASLPVVGGSALVAALRRAYDRPITVGWAAATRRRPSPHSPRVPRPASLAPTGSPS